MKCNIESIAAQIGLSPVDTVARLIGGKPSVIRTKYLSQAAWLRRLATNPNKAAKRGYTPAQLLSHAERFERLAMEEKCAS